MAGSSASETPDSPDSIPPQYKVAVVEAVLLEVAVELHPEHPSTVQLLAKIVANPEDDKEMATGMHAIQNLREFGLLAARDDELVEPTPPALRAVALLT